VDSPGLGEVFLEPVLVEEVVEVDRRAKELAWKVAQEWV